MPFPIGWGPDPSLLLEDVRDKSTHALVGYLIGDLIVLVFVGTLIATLLYAELPAAHPNVQQFWEETPVVLCLGVLVALFYLLVTFLFFWHATRCAREFYRRAKRWLRSRQTRS